MSDLSEAQVRDFARWLAPDRADNVQLRSGVVQSFTADKVNVFLSGSSFAVGINRLASLDAIVGDTVWILKNGPDYIALGRVGLGERTYNPLLTGSVSNPNLGTTGGILGTWSKSGPVVTFWVFFQFNGAGVNAGSGLYEVSLPVAAHSQWAGFPTGGAVLNDSGTGYVRSALISGNTSRCHIVAENGVAVTNAIPFAWGAGDFCRISGSYFADF